ncbi:MAG: FAD-dependent oxidoreductase [Pseudomonadota bacterium]
MQDRYPLAFQLYPYQPVKAETSQTRHPVIVIGGGPVGLAIALDLGRQNIPVLLLDDHEGPGQGSRAICFAKRTLEIAARYGCAADMVEKGVVWNVGKIFRDDRQLYAFNLLAEEGHRFPAFINLQQPYFEKFLVAQIRRAQAKGAPIEIRGRNRVDRLLPGCDSVALTVQTPDGPYETSADWVVACDGAGSPIRKMMGLGFEGQVFEDNFLIADIKMDGDFPTERWFWFDPWFKSGASTLLHKQPDGIWRVDFQIGWDVDRKVELREENIRTRLDAMLGPKVTYELVWTSIYTFQCRRMTQFRHNRVLFAGDAAHQVSPFGARGANSGIQDADNLGWKLGLVLSGKAPEKLLDSYDSERRQAADENILNSTRSTEFITPKSRISQVFRDAVLDLAAKHAFARPLVNSGRLSQPSTYDGSELNGEDALPGGPSRTRPGSPCPDAPVKDGYMLDALGDDFCLLCLNISAPETVHSMTYIQIDTGRNDEIRERYLGNAEQAVYLIRPDQHVVARWNGYDPGRIDAALRTAKGMAA